MSDVQHGNQPEGTPEVVHGGQPLTEEGDVTVVVHGDQPRDDRAPGEEPGGGGTPPLEDNADTPTSDDDGSDEDAPTSDDDVEDDVELEDDPTTSDDVDDDASEDPEER